MPPDDLTAPVLLDYTGPYTAWVPPSQPPAQTNAAFPDPAHVALTAESLFAAYREGLSRWLPVMPVTLPPPDEAETRRLALLGRFRFGHCIAPISTAPENRLHHDTYAPSATLQHIAWLLARHEAYRAATSESVLRRRERAVLAWEAYTEAEDARLDAEGEPRWGMSLPRLVEDETITRQETAP